MFYNITSWTGIDPEEGVTWKIVPNSNHSQCVVDVLLGPKDTRLIVPVFVNIVPYCCGGLFISNLHCNSKISQKQSQAVLNKIIFLAKQSDYSMLQCILPTTRDFNIARENISKAGFVELVNSAVENIRTGHTLVTYQFNIKQEEEK